MDCKKKYLTLGDLKERIDKILEENLQAKDYDFLVDVEARKYHSHLVRVEAIHLLNIDYGEGDGDVILYLDTSNTSF